jgi:hypothetical protein
LTCDESRLALDQRIGGDTIGAACYGTTFSAGCRDLATRIARLLSIPLGPPSVTSPPAITLTTCAHPYPTSDDVIWAALRSMAEARAAALVG